MWFSRVGLTRNSNKRLNFNLTNMSWPGVILISKRCFVVGAGHWLNLGAGALEIAPEVELEQAAGMVGTAAIGEIVAGFEPQRGEIKAVDKSVDGAHGAGGRNVVVHRRREQHRLVTVASFNQKPWS